MFFFMADMGSILQLEPPGHSLYAAEVPLTNTKFLSTDPMILAEGRRKTQYINKYFLD